MKKGGFRLLILFQVFELFYNGSLTIYSWNQSKENKLFTKIVSVQFH